MGFRQLRRLAPGIAAAIVLVVVGDVAYALGATAGQPARTATIRAVATATTTSSRPAVTPMVTIDGYTVGYVCYMAGRVMFEEVSVSSSSAFAVHGVRSLEGFPKRSAAQYPHPTVIDVKSTTSTRLVIDDGLPIGDVVKVILNPVYLVAHSGHIDQLSLIAEARVATKRCQIEGQITT